MRPVFFRELKELSPALLVLLVISGIVGAVLPGPIGPQIDDMLLLPIIAGLGLGLIQGGLDRWRRGDLFALHRPVPALRMEAARTLAGVAVGLLGVLALAVSHRIATLLAIESFARMRAEGYAKYATFDQLGFREIGLLAGFMLAAWAVVRFAAGAVRIGWALPALIALPLGCWSVLARTGTPWGAACVALALAVLFSVGNGLCLAGDRR